MNPVNHIFMSLYKISIFDKILIDQALENNIKLLYENTIPNMICKTLLYCIYKLY